MKARLAGLVAAGVLAISSWGSRAQAQTSFADRGFVLPSGSFELTGTPARPLMVSTDPLDPVLVHPHFYWGVSDSLTAGISHGRGLCIGDACGDTYNDVGLDMILELVSGGDLELDGHFGVPIGSFDPFYVGVRGGLLGRYTIANPVSLVWDPFVYVGANQRDEGNNDFLGLPLWLYGQVVDPVALFVGVLPGAPLDDLGQMFDDLDVEAGVVFSVTDDVDLGVMMDLDDFGDWFGMVARFRF